MHVEFLGAAGTVTGSMHLVHVAGQQILLDCGLFQGPRRESQRRNRELPLVPHELDAVVLSHAHIDHSGALPVLTRQGYGGTVYATPATRSLCAVMLDDAADIQASDARYVNRRIAAGELDGEPVEPLYELEDVVRLLGQMVAVPYHRPIAITPNAKLTFFDAGHVLGSAAVALDLTEDGRTVRLVFSGDLGRHGTPLLRDPEIPPGAQALIVESTYGDRLHPPRPEMTEELGRILGRTLARGGRAIIPTFALERAQEILHALRALKARGELRGVPVVMDSPLAVKVTDVFRMHLDVFDAEARALFEAGHSPFDFPDLRYVSDVEESKALSAGTAPAVILAASGMCESGRVLHHLRTTLGDPNSTVVIVGFQAPHTLGRRLVERRARVRIFGVERDRLCDVAVLNGFSAHADQAGLLDWVESVRAAGALGPVALVHGEPPAQRVLRTRLEDAGLLDVRIPEPGDRMHL
jgi:metallo-beta-lactamase family protein